MKATRALYASPAWRGLPPLFTRYGLHTARVMVGHFGAPDRLCYTALGDGVNLAARLEALCKQYGVVALASEAIVDGRLGDAFAFRLVDRVAVKGKHAGGAGLRAARGAARAELRRALRSGLRRLPRARLRAARRTCFARCPDDPPSRVLAARCEAMAIDPPPADWNGVYVAKTK